MYLRTSCTALVAIASIVLAAPPVSGHDSYFTNQCAGCHTNDNPTCIGCHHHGGSPSSPTTNKTQYAPGETVTVTMNGSTRQAWARAILYNQNDQEIARITGPTNTGDDGVASSRLRYPFVLQAPAPTQPGAYTWKMSWWGNNNGAGHIEGTRNLTNSFQVVAPLTGAVTINAGAAYTNSLAVNLSLSTTGGTPPLMRFSNDNLAWNAWEPYAATKAWSLAPGDGAKTVYVQFGDISGSVLAAANDSITLDATVPTGSIVINSGAASTTATTVTLTLSASDAGSGVSQMRLRNETLAWSVWQAFAATKTWVLVAGRGTKTVSVQFNDGAGNVSNIYSDTIVLNVPGQTAAARWEMFR